MDTDTGTPKVPSQDERRVLALRELILSAFQDKFGHAVIIGVNIKPSLLFSSIATVMVSEYVSDMDKLAEHMEWEITEDLGCPMAIFVKQPIRHRIAGLLKGR
ncbi:hypothetical protein [Candidatus Methylomirabilis sp.]|uniref:Uncharacterized protein n=1 Tax=Candidatus Methylomirabilis tolerans TaxID=3123416 RepID=A0AAJ1AGL9_9BACT|nr:hypothetical protein [Candidatus Methylomirabilis sp.]